MMRRKILFAVLFCIVGPYMFSQSRTLSQKDAAADDLYSVYMSELSLPGQLTDLRIDEHDYIRSTDRFLSGLDAVSDGMYRRISGRWVLNEMPAPDRSTMRYAFAVPEISIDTDYKTHTPVIRVPAVSALYQDRVGDIYFKISALGILEKIIPSEGRLKLYHLENDTWKQDAIYRNLNFWKSK